MKKITFILLPLFLLFTGCINEYPEYYKAKYLLSTNVTDFNELAQDLVDDMDKDIISIIPKSKRVIYVSDFVNIQNLEVTSQLGFFLSSEVKSYVTSKYNLNIKEIEYTKYLKFNETGLRTLSRDYDEINKDNINKSYILAGTYAITQRQLILYLKLIDMKNGNLVRATSKSINLTDEVIKLEENNNQNRPILRPRLVL